VRLSDLLGQRVVDAAGAELGRVHDVRLVQDGPPVGPFGAGLRVTHLIVGPSAVASRLGYDRADVGAPWIVAAVARRLRRRALLVPWDEVEAMDGGVVTLTRRADGPDAPIAPTEDRHP
jgi:sporulation protein YlmC with PRC-barrel domain